MPYQHPVLHYGRYHRCARRTNNTMCVLVCGFYLGFSEMRIRSAKLPIGRGSAHSRLDLKIG